MSDTDAVAPPEAPPTLFRVTGGGDPSAEELAALTVAVISLQGGGSNAPEPAPSGWQRAAIAEAVGGRPAYSAADTNRVRYLRPHPG